MGIQEITKSDSPPFQQLLLSVYVWWNKHKKTPSNQQRWRMQEQPTEPTMTTMPIDCCSLLHPLLQMILHLHHQGRWWRNQDHNGRKNWKKANPMWEQLCCSLHLKMMRRMMLCWGRYWWEQSKCCQQFPNEACWWWCWECWRRGGRWWCFLMSIDWCW